jgi:quinoprotein glucose dehydrogenase
MSSTCLPRPFALLVRARDHFALLAIFAGFLAGSHPLAVEASTEINAQPQAGEGWPTYGGDPGGTRFSKSSQITRSNVTQLHPVWTFHTHAVDTEAQRVQLPSFEATPVLSGDTLYFTSPFDVVFAINARTGEERWHFDPILKPLMPKGIVTSRGVALWSSTVEATCSHRVFWGTLDARLLSLDAKTGKPCINFGNNGTVDLSQGVHFQGIGFYGMTSPPTVVGNVVVVGSTIGDNQQVDIESGVVRGYDAVSGKLLWTWEPLPWAENQKIRTGAGNVWGVISADPSLGLVYLPTGSAAPDIYGGMRPGDNRDANSVVALDAKTGKKVWAFQVVHHDVWDYDIPSEPILFTWRGTPAIAVTTKMGMIFLFDRRTGQPLVPIEERPVPQSDVPGEKTSPTQPFQNVPSLAPLVMGGSPNEVCRKQLASVRYEGIYTPPSLKGSLNYPGPTGGVNWGGAAIDPNTGILYANTNRIASITRLIPRRRERLEKFERQFTERVAGPYLFRKKFWTLLFIAVFVAACSIRRSLNPGWTPMIVAILGAAFIGGYHSQPHPAPSPIIDHFGYEISPQRKSPYLIERHPLVDSQGLGCTPQPWGAIGGVNLNTLTKAWEKPLGTMVPDQRTGIRNFGGPIVTASGLVITAGAEDFWLRVFDSATGEELQKIPLPVPAVATPMTYTLDGRQYIVVAAGGHGDGTVPLGDSLIAFTIN